MQPSLTRAFAVTQKHNLSAVHCGIPLIMLKMSYVTGRFCEKNWFYSTFITYTMFHFVTVIYMSSSLGFLVTIRTVCFNYCVTVM